MFKRIHSSMLIFISFGLALTPFFFSSQVLAGATIERVNVTESRAAINQNGALMVCSYADRRCQNILFQGALLLSEFEAQLPNLDKDRAIIFYCN